VTSIPIAEGYVEHAPPPALREYVECFWTRGKAEPSERHHVIPDGCIDLVMAYESVAATENPAATLAVGTMTRPLSVSATEAGAFVGVRFWPGRALPFLGVPACEITDLRVAVADLGGREARGLASIQHGALAGWRADLEALLTRRLASAAPVDRTVDAALGAILRAAGNLSISALAPALGVTRQHLARAFALHVGVSPKTFARVARVRRILARARVASVVDWTALALDAGFYDQAHLSGEVRELTGRAPTEWLRSA
jgi:methylphosphotriester-DNA--protein-cysteine methyltransferase